MQNKGKVKILAPCTYTIMPGMMVWWLPVSKPHLEMEAGS